MAPTQSRTPSFVRSGWSARFFIASRGAVLSEHGVGVLCVAGSSVFCDSASSQAWVNARICCHIRDATLIRAHSPSARPTFAGRVLEALETS